MDAAVSADVAIGGPAVADGAPARASATRASRVDSVGRVRIVAPDRPMRPQRESSPTAGRFRQTDRNDDHASWTVSGPDAGQSIVDVEPIVS